jgi:hypothetical protein
MVGHCSITVGKHYTTKWQFLKQAKKNIPLQPWKADVPVKYLCALA